MPNCPHLIIDCGTGKCFERKGCSYQRQAWVGKYIKPFDYLRKRRFFYCKKYDDQYWKYIRRTFKPAKRPRANIEVERHMDSLCKVCGIRPTDTIICETCWDKIQVLKIRSQMFGSAYVKWKVPESTPCVKSRSSIRF